MVALAKVAETTRRARKPRPTGEQFDADRAVARAMSRYPNIMAILAE